MLSPLLSYLIWLTPGLFCSMVSVWCAVSLPIPLFWQSYPSASSPVVLARRCAAMHCACIGCRRAVDAWFALMMVRALWWQHNQ